MTKAEFLPRLEDVRTGKRHGRVPHKPLLLRAPGRVGRLPPETASAFRTRSVPVGSWRAWGETNWMRPSCA